MKELTQEQLAFFEKESCFHQILRVTNKLKSKNATSNYIAEQQLVSICRFLGSYIKSRRREEKIEIYERHIDVVAKDGRRKVVNGEDALDAAVKLFKEIQHLDDVVY